MFFNRAFSSVWPDLPAQSCDPQNVFLIIVYSSSEHVNWRLQLQRSISKSIPKEDYDLN